MIMKYKTYLLRETKTIESYDDKKEAIADRDNHTDWYPENSFEVIEQIIDDGKVIKSKRI